MKRLIKILLSTLLVTTIAYWTKNNVTTSASKAENYTVSTSADILCYPDDATNISYSIANEITTAKYNEAYGATAAIRRKADCASDTLP